MNHQNVIDQLISAGLIIDGMPEIGRLVRCMAEGDKGRKKSGWYVLHELRLDNGDTVLVGSYGNWRRFGDEQFKIEFKGTLNDAERERLRAETLRLREQARAEKAERAADAAKRAKNIWAKLPNEGASPYLARKKVRAFGVRFSRGSLVVPVMTVGGELVGLQFIYDDGAKKFLTGTPKRGCCHFIGSPADARVIAIAEGYATAASIHMATQWAVAVAFDAGNLKPVADAVRQIHPDKLLMICADDDSATEGNPGVTKARAAAQSAGASVVVPVFDNTRAQCEQQEGAVCH